MKVIIHSVWKCINSSRLVTYLFMRLLLFISFLNSIFFPSLLSYLPFPSLSLSLNSSCSSFPSLHFPSHFYSLFLSPLNSPFSCLSFPSLSFHSLSLTSPFFWSHFSSFPFIFPSFLSQYFYFYLPPCRLPPSFLPSLSSYVLVGFYSSSFFLLFPPFSYSPCSSSFYTVLSDVLTLLSSFQFRPFSPVTFVSLLNSFILH